MTSAPSLNARSGRLYFAAQAAAGVLWWIAVTALPPVRAATLGDLPPVWMAVLDVPLFVAMSACAAAGVRWCADVAAGWTVLITVGMVVYATITERAGWGAVAMIAASVGSVAALLLTRLGRIPGEWLFVGPFAIRPAESAPPGTHLRRTAAQIVVFWGGALLVVPAIIAALEWRWGVHLRMPDAVPAAGAIVLLTASALGIWSAAAMARRGDGTPLPRETARRLVITGPYHYVRNPMAVAGIAQGVAVGMLCESWMVIAYALCGSVVWNHLIRPREELDLVARFGEDYERYRLRVSCWIPRRPRDRRHPSYRRLPSYTDPDV